MATTTPRLVLRKPATSDIVNVVSDINDNMDKIDAATGFERLAAFPATPHTGKGVIRSDQSDRAYVWNGTAWKELIVIENLTAVQQVDETADETGITSTTFIAGTASLSTTFVAPPSGKVAITVRAATENSDVGTTTPVSFEVRNDNVGGTVVFAANDSDSVASQGPQFIQASIRTIVTGLTFGNTYFVRTMHKRSGTGGTGSIFSRGLIIEPVLR